MQGTTAQRWSGLTALGTGLVVVGVGWFALRELRIDVLEAISTAGWPYLVILPGIALLVASLLPTPPRGVGFAIAGTIVTAVGCVLLYQQTRGHWTSWAYAWALVGPGAAGLGMLTYGLVFGGRDLAAAGARLVAIAATIFAVGFWYFETIFTAGHAPFDLGEWWPAVLVGAGFAVLVAALLGRGSTPGEPRVDPSVEGGVR